VLLSDRHLSSSTLIRNASDVISAAAQVSHFHHIPVVSSINKLFLCAILHIIYSFKRICAVVKQSCATKAVDFVGAAVEFLPQSECSRRLTEGKGKQFKKFL